MQKDTVYTGCMWQMTIVSTIEVDVHVHQRGRVQAFTVFVEDRHTEESVGCTCTFQTDPLAYWNTQVVQRLELADGVCDCHDTTVCMKTLALEKQFVVVLPLK